MKGKVCVFGSFNLDVVAVMNRFPCRANRSRRTTA